MILFWGLYLILHVLVELSTMIGRNMNYFWPLWAPGVMLCDSSGVWVLFVWPNLPHDPLPATPLQRAGGTGDSKAKSPIVGHFWGLWHSNARAPGDDYSLLVWSHPFSYSLLCFTIGISHPRPWVISSHACTDQYSVLRPEGGDPLQIMEPLSLGV